MYVAITNGIATIAKGFTQKREKRADDTEAVFGHLKFSKLEVTREIIDELRKRPIGHTQKHDFNTHGLPISFDVINLEPRDLSLTGSVTGTQHEDGVSFNTARLESVTLELCKLGAWMSGEIIWELAGDESGDLVPLHGNECKVNWVIQDARQEDLVDRAGQAA